MAHKKESPLFKSIPEKIFTWNPFKVKRASLAAWQTYMNYREQMFNQRLTPPKAIEKIIKKTERKEKIRLGCTNFLPIFFLDIQVKTLLYSFAKKGVLCDNF
jgi:hypothetical protein